jgi:hypothetical protein
MEQTAVANKPDISVAILDNVIDSPDKPAIAVITVMGKHSGRRIKLVEAAVLGAKPKTTPPVSGDARNVSTADTVWVLGVMKIAGKAVAYRIEFIHPGISGNPQIPVIVFRHIFNKVRA